MQVYLISFRQKWTPAHLFPLSNLKTGQVLWCIIVFEFRTKLSELWCQWVRRYVPQCVYKNTSNSLTSTQWREAAQSHATNRNTTALASHKERWLMWCLLCECLSVQSFNEDQYQGLHCFELSDPWRWPLHSSATDLVCGIICCSPSTHEMKRLNTRTHTKNRLVYELCAGEKRSLVRLKRDDCFSQCESGWFEVISVWVLPDCTISWHTCHCTGGKSLRFMGECFK